jgi:CRP/FNR family transcriptional regulator, cyclic AMP receptor protein
MEVMDMEAAGNAKALLSPPGSAAPYGLRVVENCVECAARPKTLFCRMSAEALREMNLIRQSALYPQGAVLFVEGETPRGLFILCSGEAKLTAGSRQGEGIILRLAESGELLGLSSVIAGLPYSATAETLTPSQVAFIPARQFQRFLRAHADVAVRVAEHLSMELHRSWEQTRLLALAPSTRSKLAQLLLDWAREHGTADERGVAVPFHMTHEEIGRIIGASRETVSRLLSDFKRRQLIRVQNGSLYMVPDELRAAAV